MERKPWQKPELISLTRCKPQEAVLSICKYYLLSGDPSASCAGCLVTEMCDDCSAYQAS